MGELMPPSKRLVVCSAGPPSVSSGSWKTKSCPFLNRCSSLRWQRRASWWVHHQGLFAALGLGGGVLGQGAFVDDPFSPLMPGVEGLTPTHGFPGVVDAGESVGEFLEFPAGLESWLERQVGCGVAVLRCICTRQRWMRVDGHAAAQAFSTQ